MPSIKVQEKWSVLLRHFLELESDHDLTEERSALRNGHQDFIVDIVDQFLSILRLVLRQFVDLAFWQLFWNASQYFLLLRAIKSL